MRRRRIGSLDVSVIGLGCNNFGRRIDAAGSRRVIDAAIDCGIDFFDTADSYVGSEEIIGEALVGRRDKVVVATKFGWALDDERRGASAGYVREAVEASLRRLGTSYVDLLQLHVPDPDTPIEETLGALNDMVAKGAVREFGVCNLEADQLREAAAAADRLGGSRVASVQVDYNLLDRSAEHRLLDECAQIGAGVIPFHPLYQGLLTGKYRSGQPVPEGTRITIKSRREQATMLSERNLTLVDDLTGYAHDHGHTLLELAFSWLVANPLVASVIAGASTPEQVRLNAAADAWQLGSVEFGELALLLAPSATP